MADTNTENRVGVIGASSLVGKCLLPLLTQSGLRVSAFSRSPDQHRSSIDVSWHQLPMDENVLQKTTVQKAEAQANEPDTEYWICIAPIWVLPDYFEFLEKQGARRVVVLSSTSRFSKNDSSYVEEQAMAARMTNAEARLSAWAEPLGISWVILRPTLIYGLGQDKNITEIARFIRRFGFFPLFGKANGLRQPIHALDVAIACQAALIATGAANQAYNISGGETLTYRQMVTRIFNALGGGSRFLNLPLWTFQLALILLRLLPRYRHWSAAMAERMNRDLVFDHTDANRDLGFQPRAFLLESTDLPA